MISYNDQWEWWEMITLIRIAIKFYQYAISPLLGQNCRFEPTCSQYMLEAVELHGVCKGCWFGLCRLARCHPWGGCGCDPVPPKKR